MSNDDIDNEFDTDDFDVDGFDDGGFDDLNDQQGTLGDLWRNNSLVKIGVILAALAFLIGGIILFGGRGEKENVSRVAAGRTITEAPGSAEVSESYRQAVEEENTRRTELAVRQSDSAIPTPIDPPKGTLPLQFEEPEEEDPLERWRRLQEERVRQQQVQVNQERAPAPPPEPEIDTRTPAINALAAAMSQQMQSVLSNQTISGPTVQNVSSLTYLENLQQQERERLEAALAAQQQLNGLPVNNAGLNILLPAGSVEYAQLVTEANSDVPGPILARIQSGDLRGSQLIGTFSTVNDYLVLNFNTLVVDDVDYAINAVAIDPATTLPGVVTDVDRRLFTRIILPGAAAFVEGLAEAISDSGNTSIFINSADGTSTSTTTGAQDGRQEVASGIEEAGEEFAEILEDIADDTEILVRVRAGTPIGVLFTSAVTDTPQLIQQRQQQDQQFQLQQLQLQNGVLPSANGINNLIPQTGNIGLTP